MKAKVLVVDDEESLVRLITHNLKREGYETIEAYDGNQAWEFWRWPWSVRFARLFQPVR